MSNPSIDSFDASPIKVDVPCELPKVSIVDASVKKLKFHLAQFDSVVKKRITPDALRKDIMNIVVNSFKNMNTSVNVKSMEMCNKCLELEAELIKQHNMEKVFVITTLKNDLRKLKGKDIVNNAAQVSNNVSTIAPGMFKIDLEPLAPKLLNNREAHSDYLKYTQEQVTCLKEIVEQGKSLNPVNNSLEYVLTIIVTICYPNNDSDNLGKLQAKADIGNFIGYAPKKKAYRIYNRRTQKIIETIHVDFDELTAMASKQSSLGPALHDITLATPSSGLPIFDEFFSPPASVASPVLKVPVLTVDDLAPVESSSTPSSTIGVGIKSLLDAV
ncbi:hypothetical protein Tco_0506156 [Tanacetum coccineum]